MRILHQYQAQCLANNTAKILLIVSSLLASVMIPIYAENVHQVY